MTLYYNGNLDIENADDEVIETLLAEYLRGCGYVEDGKVELDGSEPCGTDSLEQFIGKLGDAGMLVSGTVDYCGDYEGRAVVSGNVITEFSSEDAVIQDASDTDLMAEVQRRGYSICRPGGFMRQEVETPMGLIIVKAAADDKHPGIWVSLRKDGEIQEDDICLVEYCSAEYNRDCFGTKYEGKETIALRVYAPDGDGNAKEEPEDPFMYPRD